MKNERIKVLIVALSLLVVGLGGYIVYDKALEKPTVIENNSCCSNDENNNNALTWEYSREVNDNTGTVYNLNLNKLSPNRIEYEITDSKSTKIFVGEETWSADLKDFDVVITQKIDAADKDYKYYAIECIDASSNAKLIIISIDINTNAASQILLINNNTRKIDYYINLKDTQYDGYDHPNEIAFRYFYGQNAKIDKYIDGFRPKYPYYFKKYGDKNMLIFIKLLPSGFDFLGIPGIEEEP